MSEQGLHLWQVFARHHVQSLHYIFIYQQYLGKEGKDLFFPFKLIPRGNS